MRFLTLMLCTFGTYLLVGTSEIHSQTLAPPPTKSDSKEKSAPKSFSNADNLPDGPIIDYDSLSFRTRTALGKNSGPVTKSIQPFPIEHGRLPRDAGQEYRTYDLRPYTGYLTKHDRPQDAVVDWILRETGRDLWFHQPFGFLSAERDALHVFHTREVHQIVGSIVDRFVAGEKDPQRFRLSMLTVSDSDWRSSPTQTMQRVSVETAGVSAWLMNKEYAVILRHRLMSKHGALPQLDTNLLTHNGQTEVFAISRGRNLNIHLDSESRPPSAQADSQEIIEGYRLEISPLLDTSGTTLDVAVKLSSDVLEDTTSISVLRDKKTTKVEVPQLSSYRLHERFRWPTGLTLLLSTGIVPAPATGSANRAEILMFIDYRRRPTMAQSGQNGQPHDPAPVRGRY